MRRIATFPGELCNLFIYLFIIIILFIYLFIYLFFFFGGGERIMGRSILHPIPKPTQVNRRIKFICSFSPHSKYPSYIMWWLKKKEDRHSS